MTLNKISAKYIILKKEQFFVKFLKGLLDSVLIVHYFAVIIMSYLTGGRSHLNTGQEEQKAAVRQWKHQNLQGGQMWNQDLEGTLAGEDAEEKTPSLFRLLELCRCALQKKFSMQQYSLTEPPTKLNSPLAALPAPAGAPSRSSWTDFCPPPPGGCSKTHCSPLHTKQTQTSNETITLYT